MIAPPITSRLIERDRVEDARRALNFFRGGSCSSQDAEMEIDEMRAKRREKQSQGQGTDRAWVIKRLMSRAYLHPFTIIFGLRTLGQWSGMPILTFYMVTVVKDSGTNLDPRYQLEEFTSRLPVNAIFARTNAILLKNRIART